MKVALVHDWLTGMRGGERCLEAFVCMYPDADLFALVHAPGTTSVELDRRVKGTSFLNSLPGVRKYYRVLLPLFPAAVRSIDLSGYDLVISLSHAAAKNVSVPRSATHICYCFTPMRYVWDQAPHYFGAAGALALDPILRSLREWDRKGADGVDHFVGISSFVAARIRKFYGRSSSVIAPPVRMESEAPRRVSADTRRFFEGYQEPFFLCAGALVPYKRIDVAVDAFAEIPHRLLVVGGGSELAKLRRRASSNVKFLGSVSDEVLWECYRRCRALIFPGIEDFGIVPVECLASGRPVVSPNAGGVRDSVVGLQAWNTSDLVEPGTCGVFFSKRGYGKPSALKQAVETFLKVEPLLTPEAAKSRAAQFSYSNFFSSWSAFCSEIGVSPGTNPDVKPAGNLEASVNPSASIVAGSGQREGVGAGSKAVGGYRR